MTASAPTRLDGARRELAAERDWHVSGERLAVGATAAAVATLPLLVPRGPANLSPVDLLIGFALVACLVWAGASDHRWRFPYALGMGLFLVGGVLGALAGPVPGAGVVSIVQDLALLAWCWAVANLASSPGRLRVLLQTWAYSSLVWAALLFVGLAVGSTALAGQEERQGGRTALTFGDPNISANYYFLSIMVIWASGYPKRLELRLAASALLLAALFTTGSNSGMASLLVGTAVAAIVALYRRRGAAAAVAAMSALVLAFSAVAASVSLTEIQERADASRWTFVREGIGRGDVSVAQRDTLFTETARLFKTGGPFGEGPASTKPRLEAEMAPLAKEAHNDYVAALVERGAIGLLGVLALVSAVALRSASLVRPGLAGGASAAVPRPAALAGAVAGTLVVGGVYELLHVRHVWALFALVAALALWSRR